MALDAAAIAAYIVEKKQAMIACGAADNPALDALMLAEANAIVHLIEHATVTTVTTCPAGAGTGTGVLT